MTYHCRLINNFTDDETEVGLACHKECAHYEFGEKGKGHVAKKFPKKNKFMENLVEI